MEKQKLDEAKQIVALREERTRLRAERLALLPEPPTRGKVLVDKLVEMHRKRWGK
jgi:hypothetical protein